MVAIRFTTVLTFAAFFSPLLSLAMPVDVPSAQQDSAAPLNERMFPLAKAAGKAAWPIAKQVGKEFMKETVTSNAQDFIKNPDGLNNVKAYGSSAAGVLQNHAAGALDGFHKWASPGGSSAQDDFIAKQLHHAM